jgi:hypothetical protein
VCGIEAESGVGNRLCSLSRMFDTESHLRGLGMPWDVLVPVSPVRPPPMVYHLFSIQKNPIVLDPRQLVEVTDPEELAFAQEALFQRHPAMQSEYHPHGLRVIEEGCRGVSQTMMCFIASEPQLASGLSIQSVHPGRGRGGVLRLF